MARQSDGMPAGRSTDRRNRLIGAFAGLILALFLGLSLSDPQLERPIEWDELVTLRYFTWAGVEPDGEARPLDRRADLHRLDAPGLRQLVIGLYCSVGRWPEPNNHVLNSLLSNLSLLVPVPAEIALRLPALAGALAFGLALFWLAHRVFSWNLTAILLLLLALSNPFVSRYALSGRGYSWLLALQVALLLAIFGVAGRPRSILRGAFAVSLATLSFINIPTMALYWVVPVYLGAWIASPDRSGRASGLDESTKAVWRRTLWIQFLCISALGALFLIDRLPYLYSASHQAGAGFTSAGSFVFRLQGVADQFFPTLGWRILAGVGFLGLLVTRRESAQRTVSIIALLAIGITTVEFLLTGRLPPSRVCAPLLPIVLLGAAGLTERLLAAVRRPCARITGWLLALAAVATLIAVTPRRSLEDPDLTRFERSLAEIPPADGLDTVVVRDPRTPLPVALYYPEGWSEIEDGLPIDRRLRLCLVVRREGSEPGDLRVAGGNSGWSLDSWPAEELLNVGGQFRVLALVGRASPLTADARGGPGVVFWYPEFDAVAVTPEPLLRHLRSHPIRYVVLQTRYQAKMEVFGRVAAIMIPVTSAAELQSVTTAVREGREDFGGEAVLFTPEPAPSQADL